MAVTNTIREPFTHTDVEKIVSAVHERLGTTEGLKESVQAELLSLLGVNQLPERVQTWVHRYCLAIISPDIHQNELSGKVAKPIDLASLKRR